jgi:hypothetical protein
MILTMIPSPDTDDLVEERAARVEGLRAVV